MKTLSHLDALYVVCSALGEILRYYNKKHGLLRYDFDNITSKEEKESLTDEFYERFAPDGIDIRQPSEDEHIIALYTFYFALYGAIECEKARQGLYFPFEKI